MYSANDSENYVFTNDLFETHKKCPMKYDSGRVRYDFRAVFSGERAGRDTKHYLSEHRRFKSA